LNKIPPFTLLGHVNASDWMSAIDHLLSYNNTLITLASTVLLSSFTATQLKIANLNLSLLHITWICSFITIVLAVILMFLNFYARLADTVWTRYIDEKREQVRPAMDDPIISKFYNSVIWIFILSVFEFLFFLVGIIFLYFSATL
jgi:hypothetical protein